MKKYQTRIAVIAAIGAISMTTMAAKPVKPHSITLTEYYDDECPHCHRMGSVIEQLKKNYPSLHITYRATPILNADSWAIASLVEAAENKKIALHETLVSLPDIPTVDEVLDMASRLGMNRQALVLNAQSLRIHDMLENNIKLAESQHATGTVALPLLVFSSGNKIQDITLIGEQPYTLLSAVVKQLED